MQECNSVNHVVLIYISALVWFLRAILAVCILPAQSVANYSQINSVYCPKHYQPPGLCIGDNLFIQGVSRL